MKTTLEMHEWLASIVGVATSPRLAGKGFDGGRPIPIPKDATTKRCPPTEIAPPAFHARNLPLYLTLTMIYFAAHWARVSGRKRTLRRPHVQELKRIASLYREAANN